ncbi:DNA polymerase III subunit beta [Sphaerobacter sp.]|uniref:DNA polymerase III subunit beta n=1 Tax=Sphaerobacter sp. TaxID=2099654 RepID=UPI001D4EB536|nr:DNA polymerase III subunit beta [Sphaerobacter sp.]MBX5445358.1 DNA polymerase III subunit beta [Sphaerobacter sp.]
MRLSCQQEDLQRALGYVSRAVSRKSTLPVLGNVLLSAEGGRLKLAATNLEIAITAWTDATVEEEGTITVRSDLLTEFVASLPNDSVSIELDRRTLSVAVSCARSKAHIKGIGAEDFPTLATIGDTEPTARIDPAEFREAIGQVAFAAATDDSRPVLAGVLAEFEGASLTLAAADGFRLSVRRCDLVEPSRESLSIVVPARALQELARIIGDLEEPIDMAVTPNRSQLLVRAGSIEFLSRLIDGHFPDVRHIIPQTYGTRMVVSRDEFLAAARRAKLFAQSNNDVVRIQMNPGDGELDPGFATISAQAAETGDNEDHLEAQVEGPQAHIAFNGRYLTEVLSVMRSTEVALEMTSPNAAGVFRPVGSDDFTHVIMPMVVGT